MNRLGRPILIASLLLACGGTTEGGGGQGKGGSGALAGFGGKAAAGEAQGGTGADSPGNGGMSQAASGGAAAGQGAGTDPSACSAAVGHKLFAGPFSTCLLREDGTPVCWGGDGWVDDTPQEPLVTLSLSQDGACGLRPDCTIVCWGILAPYLLEPPAGSFADVVAGY